VLAAGRLPALDVVDAAERARVLHAWRAGGERLADALPPRGRSRRAPATLADRRRRVRDAEPGRATVGIAEYNDLAAGGGALRTPSSSPSDRTRAIRMSRG